LTDANGQTHNRHWIGHYGEKVAAAWLRAHHCRILATNFKGPKRGEVDIIARKGRLLLFIEVKTRRSDTRIRPLTAVNRNKQSLIERGANAWLRQLGTRNLPWRFDVIEVLLSDGHKPDVRHIENAF
jgi:putative endonuclease